MAIAFGGQASGSGTGTSVSKAITTTGSHVTIVVLVNTTTIGNITGVTANGSAMTKQGTSASTSQGPVNAWAIANAGAFTGNITVSSSNSQDIFMGIVWYSGTSDTLPLDSVVDWATTTNGTISGSTTTIADNSWVVMVAQQGGGTISAGAGTTLRETAIGTMADGNAAVTPAGSSTLNLTGNTGTAGYLMLSIAPTASAPAASSINRGLSTLGVGQ